MLHWAWHCRLLVPLLGPLLSPSHEPSTLPFPPSMSAWRQPPRPPVLRVRIASRHKASRAAGPPRHLTSFSLVAASSESRGLLITMADPPPEEPPPASSPPLPVTRGEGALSPLSGCYLLVVVSDPQSVTHKDTILSKITKGKNFRLWICDCVIFVVPVLFMSVMFFCKKLMMLIVWTRFLCVSWSVVPFNEMIVTAIHASSHLSSFH